MNIQKIKLKLLLIFLTLFANTALQAQVIRTFNNGGFELPVIGTVCYAILPTQFIPGWQTSHPSNVSQGTCIPTGMNGFGPLVEMWSTGFQGANTAAGAGNQFAELNANVASTLYQTVCLAAGETLQYNFLHRGRVSATVPDQMNFSIYSSLSTIEQKLASVGTTNNGTTISPVATVGSITAADAGNGWVKYTGSATVPTAGSKLLGLESATPGSLGNFIDNFVVTLKPFIEFSAPTTSAREANTSFRPRIKIAGTVPPGGMTVQLQVNSASTAALGTDFTTPGGASSFSFTVPAGTYDGVSASTYVNVPITLIDNNLIQDNRTIVLSLLASPTSDYSVASLTTCGGTAVANATHIIIDDDVDVSTAKTVSTGSLSVLRPGGTTQFEITFNNTSNAVATTTVSPVDAHDGKFLISDLVPANLSFLSWTCTSSGGSSTACPAASGSGAISSTANIGAGGQLKYLVVAQVSATATCGSAITNQSVITAIGATGTGNINDGAGLTQGTNVATPKAATQVLNISCIVPTTEQGTAPAGVTTTAIANVVGNDSVNGAPATLGAGGNATITPGVLPTGVTLNTTTGAITVSPSTPPGTYTFSYILCDKNTPPNCAPMTDTLVVTPAKGGISGIAWVDANGNGTLDVNELRVPSLRVGVFTTNSAGVRTEVTNPAARPITDANGQYRIPDLPSSDFGGPRYEIVFFNEAGVVILGTPKSMSGTSNDGTVPNTLDRIIGVKVPGGGETTLQNLPLDPSGVVYNSATRLPVAGAAVTFNGPAGFNPAVHLVGGAANVSQTTGPSGIYQFLLLPGAPAGTYAISVTPPASYTLSSSIPAQAGAFPSAGPAGGTNPVVPNAQAPRLGSNDPTTYYLTLVLIPGTSADVINNHIPLDFGVQPKLGISKVANKASGELGDTVLYTVKLRNLGQTVVPAGVSITDRLPAGFRYILGTSQATLPGTVVSTAIADPSGGVGAVLGYSTTQALQVGAEYLLQYRVRIGVGAQQGDGINRVQAKSGISVSNEAQAKVNVADGVFTSDGCVAGKVFVDCNNNHIQDAEELGIPAVRMYMEDGTYFVTDSEGKYSYCGISAKSHVISVDMLTMPRGSRMTTTSNRNLGDGNSIFLDVKSGQIIRADFAEGSCSNTTLEQVKARRTQGEVRSTDTEKTGQPALKFQSKSPSYPQRGTDSANQPLVVPRTNSGSTNFVPEKNKPVPQIPGSSSNTQGANVRNAQ
jgi:uncharacterized repeat protein (TIGR01451 family)